MNKAPHQTEYGSTVRFQYSIQSQDSNLDALLGARPTHLPEASNLSAIPNGSRAHLLNMSRQ